jgi:hypothetical protein
VGGAVSAGRWMNITDYEGADDCYRLPMVYLEFNLPTNISSSSAYVFHSFSNHTHDTHDTQTGKIPKVRAYNTVCTGWW